MAGTEWARRPRDAPASVGHPGRLVEIRGFTDGAFAHVAEAESSDQIAMDEAWRNRKQEGGTWRPANGFDNDMHAAFSIEDSWACLGRRGSFYIARAKSDAAELNHRAISDDDWPQFIAAIAREWNAAVGIEAATTIMPEDAARIRSEKGDQIVTGRILLRRGPAE